MKREQKAIKASKKKFFPQRYCQKIYRVSVASVLAVLVIGASAQDRLADVATSELNKTELSIPACVLKESAKAPWFDRLRNVCGVDDGVKK